MSDINIIPVGSGSTGNSIYLEIYDYKLLIDMGMGYRKIRDALNMYDRNIEDLDAIFLTHGHYDHTRSASAICNHVSCKVYCHNSVMYPIRDIRAERVCIELNQRYEILPGLNVHPFSIPHDYVKTCAYTFTYKDKKVGYITDCGKMSDTYLELLKDSDVVIIESNHDVEMLKNGPYPKDLQRRILSERGHLSNEDCGDAVSYLYDNGTRNFLLAHISQHNNTPELALETVKEKINGNDYFIYVCPADGNDLLSF